LSVSLQEVQRRDRKYVFLNPVNNTIKKTNRFADISNFNITKGIEAYLKEAWGVKDNEFIGHYGQDKEGNYWIDDLRKPN
jgi:hypothetical protein